MLACDTQHDNFVLWEDNYFTVAVPHLSTRLWETGQTWRLGYSNTLLHTTPTARLFQMIHLIHQDKKEQTVTPSIKTAVIIQRLEAQIDSIRITVILYCDTLSEFPTRCFMEFYCSWMTKK